ncbi:helix-turn-helix transcriptional regulator [Candidatus Poribacteria bacterium]|nr:helix-turn-helix transcriptional regulator [Candidatus Poribacteria bacterium]MYF53141.1 helix-turn-helix transcriptional regulator [Gammaproteobacteria bacterium]MYK24614.1 helix-turn-helix transcriptional regulator [Candidatus Poribacteria bacterium]
MVIAFRTITRILILISMEGLLMNWYYTGKQLKALREIKGLTQQEVSDILGLKSTANISDWENDREDVPDKHRKKLLEIYGIP